MNWLKKIVSLIPPWPAVSAPAAPVPVDGPEPDVAFKPIKIALVDKYKEHPAPPQPINLLTKNGEPLLERIGPGLWRNVSRPVPVVEDYIPEVTDWFPPDVKPVYEGFYERDYESDHPSLKGAKDYFDGANWYFSTRDEFETGDLTNVKSHIDDFPVFNWRGLTQPHGSEQ